MRATLHVIMVCQKDGKWFVALPTRSTIDVVGGRRLIDTVNGAVKRWMNDHFRVQPSRIQSFKWGESTIAVAEVKGDSIDALLKASGGRRVWQLLDHAADDARVIVHFACRNTFLEG